MHIQIILYKILSFIFQGLNLALMARILISWVPHNPDHQLVSWLYNVTDPLLQPFRDIIPTARFGIDLSPIFAFLVLGMLQKLIYSILF
jgi:YggT family protein